MQANRDRSGQLPGWSSILIVFISNACIMTLELVAGRIIAPNLGVSLYTWTSVIGVVLAGISLGNGLGGRLADRRASLRLLGAMFVLSGLTTLGVLAIDQTSWFLNIDWPILLETVVWIAALFFIPSTILGTISPIVAKLTIDDLDRAGRTVGRIYAFGSLGSIVGTFITGFWLISWLGTYTIVLGVAAVLLILGLFFLLRRHLVAFLAAAAVVITAAGWADGQPWLENTCLRETNYFCIKIRDEEREGEDVRILILDRLVHSFTSLANPTQLVYDYEKIYAELTAYQDARYGPLRTLSIGGGGYTFPKYLEAEYPRSEIDVIEIDPGVTDIAYEYMGLPTDTRVESFNEDARLYLERVPTKHYDVVIGDAFDDFSVPYHLTTQGFNERVRAWLEPHGIYVVNVIDGSYGRFIRAYIHTLRQTFDHVYAAPSTSAWRQASRTTWVVVGSRSPLDPQAFDADSLWQRQRLSEDEVDSLLAESDPVLLTDRFAPVEQMLAPVFLEKTADEPN
jgi:spermidine synthase